MPNSLAAITNYRDVCLYVTWQQCYYEGKSISKLDNHDWKETYGDDMQTTFMWTTSSCGYTVDGDSPVCSNSVFDALQICRPGDLHRPSGSMLVFDTCPPFQELLHPIRDCLTWQTVFTAHGQHFFVDILCCHIFCPQKTHNATLFYRGTRIQERRHLVTAAPSLLSCAYRSLRVTTKLDSAAI